MDPDRAKQLDDLLLAALERPDCEQHAFLEEACAGDETLLREALACLALEEKLGGFLETPAGEAMRDHRGESSSVAFGERPEDRRALTDPEATRQQRPGDGGETRSLPFQARRQETGDAPPAPPAEEEEEWQSQLGRRKLGAYELVGHVGAGGMGEVYMGEDVRLGRRVAIKILPPSMAGRPRLLERFEREARVLATLNHPNIVTIHSVEEDEGIRFLTMELVEGKTLRETIPQGGLPLEDFLRIATEMTDALAAAHERGVIHRDLKPANVMITRDGRVKILDFGIAKVSGHEQTPLSEDGMLFGTVPYMAPEQLTDGTADARSDLFSLGIVLFEMLTGQHPFPVDGTLARISAILEHEPPPLGSLREDLPEGLTRILARCLAKTPDERYRTAGELRAELEELQERRLTEKILEKTRPNLLIEPPPRRSGAMLSAVAAAVLATVALVFVLVRDGPTAPAAAGERPALAVLAFQDLSGDPGTDWLSNGIAELLATDLSQSPDLKVLSAGEVHRILKASGAPDDAAPSPELLRKVAEQGEVEVVLRGSYARIGDVLRIAYRIDDPMTGETLRSGSLEGPGEESLFDLVDQLSAAVFERFQATRPELGPATVRAATTASLAALQAYVEAQTLYKNRSQHEQAIAKLEEALRIDPDFALAMVSAAKMHQSLGHNAEAQDYTQRAIELVERLPLRIRFDVEAGYYGTRWATTGQAIETYALALRVYPSQGGWRNNLARRYAFFERYSKAIEEFQVLIDSGREFWGNYQGAANSYLALGEFEQGYRLLSDFTEKIPDNWMLHYSLAWHLTEGGRYEEAAQSFARALELRPDSLIHHYGRWRLEVLREDWQQADREARRLLSFEDSFAHWRGGVALARNALYHGRSDAALPRLDDAIDASTGGDRALARCFRAELLLARGESGRAREEAQRAREEGREQWPELRGTFLAALAEQALGRPAAADALREILRQRWLQQTNAVEERQLLHLSGLLALGRGDTEAGLRELERAAALLPARGIEFSWHVFPDHVPIWTDLGEAELAAGRPRAALRWLRRASESGSEHLEQPVPFVRSFYLRGLAHLRLGERAEARRSFERFLGYWADGDLDPDSLAAARSHLRAGEGSSTEISRRLPDPPR